MAALLATFAFIVTPATTAFAACPEVGQVSYSFSSVTTSKILSNLRSDYLAGPGTITYTKTTTGQVSASMTATVSAEAGIVFAKASASIGVTVGASWSKSDTWSYSKPVPAGKTARLVMWHESRKFVVKKTQIVAPCNVKTVYTETVNAPLTSNINVWDLQYL
ncbi:hypothetical protein [Dactylosporangium sp. NPDC051484]|uniref:hypothetical protein n=1 Tax=Dactylosporangium sp. NPDC051484 TaxID=3154942 RepID=UPI00344BD117